MHCTRTWLVVSLLALGAGGIWLLCAEPMPAKDDKPTIAWSMPKFSSTMFPGTSSTTKVSFQSSATLTNVIVDVTPSLEDVLAVSPKSFTLITANQTYELTFTLKAPPGFERREFGGTIKIRKDGDPSNNTYARPLEVGLRTDWSSTLTAMGLVVANYPTDWTVSQETIDKTFLYSPTAISLIVTGDAITPPNITIRVLDNSTQVELTNFIRSYRRGWFATYQSIVSKLVGGHQAIMAKDLSASIPSDPALALFVQVGNSVVLITGDGLDQPQFESLINSIVIP